MRAALDTAPLGGPSDEAAHLCAVLPDEPKKIAGVHTGGFSAEKGLEAPAQIRALPRA